MPLIAGLVLFLGSHSISIVAPQWRDRTAVRLGEARWQGLYALASIAGFALLVWGYGQARLEAPLLYAPPYWMRHVALLLLVPVFPLMFATYLPGRIKAAVKHPMLLGTLLWAFAHLLANGTWADVLLFGGFLVWAAADRYSVARRAPRPVPGAPSSPLNDAMAVVLGLALYIVFLLGAHRWLTGVSPLG